SPANPPPPGPPPPPPPPGGPPGGPPRPPKNPNSRCNPSYPRSNSRAEFVCDPPMYGRSDAGTSSTTATHQPLAPTKAAPATTSRRTQCRTDPHANNSHVSANAGTTRYACRYFVRNANPTITDVATTQRSPPDSIARIAVHAATTNSNVSSASGLSNRNIR